MEMHGPDWPCTFYETKPEAQVQLVVRRGHLWLRKNSEDLRRVRGSQVRQANVLPQRREAGEGECTADLIAPPRALEIVRLGTVRDLELQLVAARASVEGSHPKARLMDH